MRVPEALDLGWTTRAAEPLVSARVRSGRLLSPILDARQYSAMRRWGVVGLLGVAAVMLAPALQAQTITPASVVAADAMAAPVAPAQAPQPLRLTPIELAQMLALRQFSRCA